MVIVVVYPVIVVVYLLFFLVISLGLVLFTDGPSVCPALL